MSSLVCQTQLAILLSLVSILNSCSKKEENEQIELNKIDFKQIRYNPTMEIFGEANDIVYGNPMSIQYEGLILDYENKYEPLLSQDLFFDKESKIISSISYNNNGASKYEYLTYDEKAQLKCKAQITLSNSTPGFSTEKSIDFFNSNGECLRYMDKWSGDFEYKSTGRELDNVKNSVKNKEYYNSKKQLVRIDYPSSELCKFVEYRYDDSGRLNSILQDGKLLLKFNYHNSDKFGNWTQVDFQWNHITHQVRRTLFYFD